MLQEPPRRTLLLDKGQADASKLFEIQQHHPHHQLRLEIEPLARPGMPQVPPNSCINKLYDWPKRKRVFSSFGIVLPPNPIEYILAISSSHTLHLIGTCPYLLLDAACLAVTNCIC